MDALLTALSEAVKAGSTLAMPALIGYYIVRAVEAIVTPLGIAGVVYIAGKAVYAGMSLHYTRGVELARAEQANHEARMRLWYVANHRTPEGHHTSEGWVDPFKGDQ